MTQLIQDILYISVSIIFCIGVYHIFVGSNPIEKSTIDVEYEKLKAEAMLISTHEQYQAFMRNWQIFNDRYFDTKHYFDMAMEIYDIVEIKRIEVAHSHSEAEWVKNLIEILKQLKK